MYSSDSNLKNLWENLKLSDVEPSHYGEKSMLLEIFKLCFFLLVLSDLKILEGKSLVSCRKLSVHFSPCMFGPWEY